MLAVTGHGVWHASDMIPRASAQSKMLVNSCFLLFDSHLRLIINVLSCTRPRDRLLWALVRSWLLLACSAALFVSCHSHSKIYDTASVDEFVLDSYKIRQGKFAILEMEGKVSPKLPVDYLEDYKDQVDEDDILNVSIYHPTRQDLVTAVIAVNSQMGFRVTEGKVELPSIGGVPVVGLTLDEARKAIQEHYSDQIHDVEVYVNYKDRLSRKVELIGLVSTPTIPVDGRIRLFEVLSKAKVPNKTNWFHSYVVRDQQLVPVDMNKLVNQGDMSQNIVMRGGDKIYVASPEQTAVMMMGEVGWPAPVYLTSGYISLREALVSVGGIPFTGDKNAIYVIRGNVVNPKIYTLPWEIIVHLPNDSLLLMPGDTVYVAATPITEWNRFIDQLIPSLSGINAASQTANGLNVPR